MRARSFSGIRPEGSHRPWLAKNAGRRSLNASSGVAGYHEDVTNRWKPLTYQRTTSAFRPPIGTAPRSFRDSETTRAPGNFSLNRSPTKSPPIHTGEAGATVTAGAFAGVPTQCEFGSATQYWRRPLARSYQSLATMPVSRGSRPVPIAVWPAHVTVVAYRTRASGNRAPCCRNRLNPSRANHGRNRSR
jgi:hypothetical protein